MRHKVASSCWELRWMRRRLAMSASFVFDHIRVFLVLFLIFQLSTFNFHLPSLAYKNRMTAAMDVPGLRLRSSAGRQTARLAG